MYLNKDDVKEITVGADPELFVRKGRHFVSGHLFECGSKAQPMKTPNAFIQNDGLALEVNITPARSQDEFVKNMAAGLNDLDEFLHSKDPQAELVARPSVFFGVSKLRTLPPFVYDLGCTPDYNSYYSRGTKPAPKPDYRLPFRTGAGHIHIGWGSGHDTTRRAYLEQCARLAKWLDVTVGLPSLLWDTDTRRRKMYGQAGSFRPKPYGMEYRVLSNAWVTNEKLVRFVYQQTKRACFYQAMGDGLPDMDVVAGCINQSNKDWRHYRALVELVEGTRAVS